MTLIMGTQATPTYWNGYPSNTYIFSYCMEGS